MGFSYCWRRSAHNFKGIPYLVKLNFFFFPGLMHALNLDNIIITFKMSHLIDLFNNKTKKNTHQNPNFKINDEITYMIDLTNI